MRKKDRRRGNPPKDRKDVTPSPRPSTSGHPKVGWKLTVSGWGSDEMPAEQAKSFLQKWQKRGAMTWDQILMAGRHGLGSETIPVDAIIPAVPTWLKESGDSLLAFRHHGLLPVVGIRVDDVFEVIWVETKFNTLYSHDGKNRR